MDRPLRSQATRDRIRDSARRLFAERGYDRTTIRVVAAAADIHPSMVMRYYGSKEGLFAAAAAFDLEMPDLAQGPPQELGRRLVAHFLQRWTTREGELPALLRISATHEQARSRLLELFRDQVAPAIEAVCGKAHAATCAGLVATQMFGLAYTRHVLRLPAVVALPDEVLVEHVGATLQRYLSAGPQQGPRVGRG